MMGNWLEKARAVVRTEWLRSCFRRYAGLGLIRATVETCRSNFGALG